MVKKFTMYNPPRAEIRVPYSRIFPSKLGWTLWKLKPKKLFKSCKELRLLRSWGSHQAKLLMQVIFILFVFQIRFGVTKKMKLRTIFQSQPRRNFQKNALLSKNYPIFKKWPIFKEILILKKRCPIFRIWPIFKVST